MYNRFIFFLALLAVCGAGCRKTDYTTVNEPAYIRVFNCLDYKITVDNKDAPQPFLTFLVDPELDAEGIPVKAAITGDFLDKRLAWSRPYPDAGNTAVFQTEYPGTAKVLAGPILNGYDLSSWAQISSGKHRVMFFSRPLSTVPFFDLEKDWRRYKLIDTILDLQAQEVYTIHVLEQEAINKTPGIYVRNETFVKQPISDSLVYVNFYNLSSKGFFRYGKIDPENRANAYNLKIRDTMNVYATLVKYSSTGEISKIPGFTGNLMGSMIRSQEPVVQPYYSFPLFPDTSSNRIFAGKANQVFTFLLPGYSPLSNPFWQLEESGGLFTELNIGPQRPAFAFSITADMNTGMVVTGRSGKYSNRSFATVNTIEYINGKFFLTTIQRKYEPPVY